MTLDLASVPVKHLVCLVVKTGNTDFCVVKLKCTCFICNKLGNRCVRSHSVSATTATYVHLASDRLETTANTTLRNDKRNRFVLKVPFGILKSHTVDLFILVCTKVEGQPVGSLVKNLSADCHLGSGLNIKAKTEASRGLVLVNKVT